MFRTLESGLRSVPGSDLAWQPDKLQLSPSLSQVSLSLGLGLGLTQYTYLYSVRALGVADTLGIMAMIGRVR